MCVDIDTDSSSSYLVLGDWIKFEKVFGVRDHVVTLMSQCRQLISLWEGQSLVN